MKTKLVTYGHPHVQLSTQVTNKIHTGTLYITSVNVFYFLTKLRGGHVLNTLIRNTKSQALIVIEVLGLIYNIFEYH